MNKWLSEKFFGGLREDVILRDKSQCVKCHLTREKHLDRYGRDITVDHKDGKGRNSTTKNNNIDNLQTLCLGCHGSKDARKLTDVQAVNIFHVRDVRGAGALLCRSYGVNVAAVRDIKSGKSWSHVTGLKKSKTPS